MDWPPNVRNKRNFYWFLWVLNHLNLGLHVVKPRLPTKGWLYPLIIYPQIQRPSSVWTNRKAEHLPIYPLGADWGRSMLCCHSHSAESTARPGLGAAHSGGGSIRELLYVGWKEPPWEQWILGIIVSPLHPTFSNEAERRAPASGERQVCGLHRTWYTKQMQIGSWALQDEKSHPPRADMRERPKLHTWWAERSWSQSLPPICWQILRMTAG